MTYPLTTWTIRLDDAVVVVTAETVEQAIYQVKKSTGRTVTNTDLVPLPTHHRHTRELFLLEPKP